MKQLLTILLIGQLLMAATLQTIKVKDSNITVISEKDLRLPLFHLQLIFQVSGSIEDGNKSGLAKLSAKLLGEGTKSHGSSKFASLLEQKAIHMSAHAGFETFVIELSCLKEQADEAFMRLKELLVDPNYSDEALQSIKAKTIGQIQSKQNDFDYLANLNLKKILFPNTPLANPSLGTIESIKSITLHDIHEFLTSHLTLSNTIVAVGGDIDTNTTKKIANILEVLKVGKKRTLPFFEASSVQKELIEKKETQQAYIYFGAPFDLKVGDEELYKAKVAMFILGSGGFGSRLMEEIRVKHGLAYSAYARASFNKSNSYFSGYMQTKLESQKEALKLTKKVLEEFVAKGATNEELEQTKKFLLGSEPLRNETMNQRLHQAFMNYYKGYSQEYQKEELEKINNLSLEELNNFIAKHPEILKLSVSIITK